MKDGTKEILKMAGFKKEIEAVECSHCPMCGRTIATNEFTDELSMKEYQISGLCFVCQNKIFK